MLTGSLSLGWFRLALVLRRHRLVLQLLEHVLQKKELLVLLAPVENVEATSLADGFGTIVEEIILNFVKDMQDNGLLMDPVSTEDRLSTFWRPDAVWRRYGDAAVTTTRRGAGHPSTVHPDLSGSSASASDS